MKRFYLTIMRNICWFLEDVYDFFTCRTAHVSEFYPSAKYEDALLVEDAKKHIKEL
jgi:hypothetical protein